MSKSLRRFWTKAVFRGCSESDSHSRHCEEQRSYACVQGRPSAVPWQSIRNIRYSSIQTRQRGFASHLLALALALVLASSLPACKGVAVYDAEHSPVPVSVSLESYNEGSEGTQYVKVTLTFDREVAVKAGYAPEIVIAGAKVKKDDMKVSGSEKGIVALIHIDKVRNGDMVISLAPEGDTAVSGLTDKTGTYAAVNKTVYALVPSGVALHRTGVGAVEVTHAFVIRGIAWVVLTDGDEAVGGSLLAGADILDGAVALHGHEFLTDDEYDVAAKLAETLTNHFGDRYGFSVEGKTVVARSLSNPNADVAITLYEYALVV